jgi:hypothetical protein
VCGESNEVFAREIATTVNRMYGEEGESRFDGRKYTRADFIPGSRPRFGATV